MKSFIFIFLFCFLSNTYSQSSISVKDYDENLYEIENVGGILIATSNLKVTHFNNGDKIFEVNSIKSLNEATKDSIPAYCHYKFDKTKTTLYNWYAVNDKRGLLPKDYIIPTNELRSKLYNKFKENPNNTVFSNSEDGIVDAKNYKLFLDRNDVFWTSDECNNLSARYFSNSFVSGGCFPKSSYYLPIRFIKISNDHITVRSSNNSLGFAITVGKVGQYGIYTYNDGTIEGVLNENLRISQYNSIGPYIIIDENRIEIGGVYNKYIEYLKDDNTLSIDIYKDNSQKNKLKRIVYSSDTKKTIPCINGEEDFRNRVYEDFNGDIQQLVKSEINIVRKNILGYEPDYMNQYNNQKNQQRNTVKSDYSNKLKFWQNKTVLNTSDFDELYEDVILYENNKMLSEAIKLLTIYIKHSMSHKSLLSPKKHRAKLFYQNSEYQKALSDLLDCEAMLNNKSDKWTKIGIYNDLENCYVALGDYTNSKKYKQKSDATFESRQAELADSELLAETTLNSVKKYCVSNSSGKYVITLSEDGSNKATFNQYDNYGNLKKTTQGEWILRDEGVYGTSYVLTFVFTGINANLPRMKFTCEYDGYGQLHGLIDSQRRTWNLCK